MYFGLLFMVGSRTLETFPLIRTCVRWFIVYFTVMAFWKEIGDGWMRDGREMTRRLGAGGR